MVEKDLLIAFGKKVSEARNKKGISQEELAFEAGFDRTYISLIERGKRNPSLKTILRLCEVLKVQPSSLFPIMEIKS